MSVDQPAMDSQQQPPVQTNPVNVLIVSGRSGSGKTSVLNILEDLGYYVIDNMPLSLLPAAASKLTQDGGIDKLSLGVDIRTLQADSAKFKNIYEQLITAYGIDNVKIIYTTAQESELVARFAATRRVHPLMVMESYNVHNLPSAIKKETETLRPISTKADITIDTSTLNIHQLKERVREYVGIENNITVNLLSFGFKYGIPIDADFIFDVRILPNPHWEPELRVKTGKDNEVAEFFEEFPEVYQMQQDIYHFLNRWLPEFLQNNRHTVTVAIGCTGGKHRSVFITEKLFTQLSKNLPSELKVKLKHREKALWGH